MLLDAHARRAAVGVRSVRLAAPTAPLVTRDLMARFKAAVWFCATVVMVLSFPIQVYTNSPLPSLIPYALIAIPVILHTMTDIRRPKADPSRSQIGVAVNVYLALVLGNTAWQTTLEYISFDLAMNALAIFLLPVVWYWYFRRTGTEHEIRAVIAATAVAGAIVGTYFAYDSYQKLGFGEVSDYAQRAFQYSLDRSGMMLEEANDLRVRPNDRSLGLLQSHAVSGAWVALGAFGTLALLSDHRRVARRATLVVFGTLVVMGLNFTSIVAFAIIIALFEFGGLSFRRGRKTELLKHVVPLLLVSSVLIALTYRLAGNVMSEWITYYFQNQADFALERGEVNRGLILGALDSIGAYLQHSYNYPLTLIFGDGFSGWGLPKGGDTGFIETMARLGLLFYTITVAGLLALNASALRHIKAMSAPPPPSLVHPARVLRFAMCVTLLVMITDGHYSTWTAKSVLPLVFFSLAMFERYLTMRRLLFLGL